MRKPPSFFISYRRDDTGAEAGRLRDSLIERLGPDTVFFDLEIEPGEDYQQALDRALASCDVLLALIGPRWETISDERGRPRLKDKKDLLRDEIRTGLKREIRVIPVLLNRDGLPTREDLPPDLYSLRRRQLFQIHRDRWHQDVDLLIERLGMTPQRKEGAAADLSESQARFVSAVVEWKRMVPPDPNPRRWVVYVDNNSDAPITVEDVLVTSGSGRLTIKPWGTVRPKEASDYELEEADFDPNGAPPKVTVRFGDSFGQKWVLANNSLRPRRRPKKQ